MSEKIDVKFNPNAEVPDTKTYEPRDIPKSRDERIADGQEKVAALKNKAKEGLGRVWKGLKDSFYIGVSRGSELPGQIAEGAGRAKEKISDTYTVAKNKATELFAGGREFISQKAAEARTRKRVRQWWREMRAGDRDVSRSKREAERRQYRQAREQDKQDNATDKSIIREEEKKVSEAEQELEERKQELIEAGEAEAKARQELKEAEENYAKAEREAEENPTELSKLTVERAALDRSLKITELKIAMANTANAQKEVRLTNSTIDKLDASIGKTREQIRDRAAAAKERKDKRRDARREYLGDKWESAKEKIARVAGKGADWMKQFGKKISSGVGKVARKVANRLDPVESDSNK